MRRDLAPPLDEKSRCARTSPASFGASFLMCLFLRSLMPSSFCPRSTSRDSFHSQYTHVQDIAISPVLRLVFRFFDETNSSGGAIIAEWPFVGNYTSGVGDYTSLSLVPQTRPLYLFPAHWAFEGGDEQLRWGVEWQCTTNETKKPPTTSHSLSSTIDCGGVGENLEREDNDGWITGHSVYKDGC